METYQFIINMEHTSTLVSVYGRHGHGYNILQYIFEPNESIQSFSTAPPQSIHAAPSPSSPFTSHRPRWPRSSTWPRSSSSPATRTGGCRWPRPGGWCPRRTRWRWRWGTGIASTTTTGSLRWEKESHFTWVSGGQLKCICWFPILYSFLIKYTCYITPGKSCLLVRHISTNMNITKQITNTPPHSCIVRLKDKRQFLTQCKPKLFLSLETTQKSIYPSFYRVANTQFRVWFFGTWREVRWLSMPQSGGVIATDDDREWRPGVPQW